jgi:RNA polymerase sigma-70 factor (ECF subfamily)
VGVHVASDGGEAELRSDAELISGAKHDPDLFRLLYDRYAVRIHAFFRRRTGSDDVALDLTAETFAQAWMSKERFRDLAAGSAGPWLFTIARRVLVASVRRRRLETHALQQLRLDAHVASAAEPQPDWLDGLDEDLRAALAGLPMQQREALALRVLGELSYTAMARRLGCTPTAARIRVSRGLKGLRARMEMNQP